MTISTKQTDFAEYRMWDRPARAKPPRWRSRWGQPCEQGSVWWWPALPGQQQRRQRVGTCPSAGRAWEPSTALLTAPWEPRTSQTLPRCLPSGTRSTPSTLSPAVGMWTPTTWTRLRERAEETSASTP